MSEKLVFRTLIGTLALLLAAIYAIAVTHDNGGPEQTIHKVPAERISRFQWHKSPQPAPLTVFRNDKGEAITFAQFAGKVVLVNLWATWCPPCLEEMPSLDKLQATLGGSDFEVVAISQDRDANDARQWLEGHQLGALEIFYDPGNDLLTSLEAPGLPVSVLLDREGREIGRMTGPAEWDSAAARAIIAKALAPAIN